MCLETVGDERSGIGCMKRSVNCVTLVSFYHLHFYRKDLTMYFVLSPAKSLDETTPAPIARFTQPDLLAHSQALMQILRPLAPHQIAELMGVSDKIARLNVERNSQWQPPFDLNNAKQAIYLFKGDVYEGIDAYRLPETAIDYLQQHVGLLSGLYGLLRPLDLMQPYRLEMGTALVNEHGKDLYAFWGTVITDALAQRLQASGSDVLINLASQEYFKAVQTKRLRARIITPVFKDQKNGQYKIISFYAKRARGLMARFAAEHGLAEPEQLQDFDLEGYYYHAASSNDHEWVFLRDAAA